jgi:hypothetical protein
MTPNILSGENREPLALLINACRKLSLLRFSEGSRQAILRVLLSWENHQATRLILIAGRVPAPPSTVKTGIQ